ncbi:MAG: redoxin domain-containing protein [Alphaproteobacteria bacterium]|nr:redoxin domain-containing protein [Alphaproteobacteria bacterium]
MIKYALTLIAFFAAHNAFAAAQVGSAAPDFTATTASGKSVKLSDYKDKIVVLEWTNPGCPFVKKFYGAGAMQKLQAETKAKDVVWLSVNSGAEGNQGYVDAGSAKTLIAEQKAVPSEYLLDAKGEIGHLYAAKTTPHMFVVDKKGILAYAGAIDDKATPNPEDIAGANNYVVAAVDALVAGKTPETTSTQSYGCSVKY